MESEILPLLALHKGFVIPGGEAARPDVHLGAGIYTNTNVRPPQPFKGGDELVAVKLYVPAVGAGA